jgi:gliding motility-associated-like protein
MRSYYILLTIGLFFLETEKIYAQSNPIEFIENRGQWDGDFRFKAMTGKSDIYLHNNAFTYLIGDPSNGGKIDGYEHGQLSKPPVLKYHVYKVTFEGANNTNIKGGEEQSSYFNYYLGNDRSRWKSEIHPYLALDYPSLYNGIDMHISSAQGNMEYEFAVRPQADPAKVRLRFDGVDKLKIKDGNLHISTSVGEVTELRPIAYQFVQGNKVTVPCKYVLRGNNLSFAFPEDYNHNETLVIDPTVVFATFTGSTADNWGFTATYDPQGNFYAGGIANGPGYPVSVGAVQTTFGGGIGNTGIQFASDIAIIKYNSTGNSRVWATYIGGSINERPHSMIVDADNNLVIAGRSNSANYPTTAGAYDGSFNGDYDIIVSKLNPTATVMIGSTYIGGSGPDGCNFDSTELFYGRLKHNYGDDARSEVQVDKQGNVYITGNTQSANYPTTPGALSGTLKGLQDGIVSKFNPTLTSLIWSTYIGGAQDDAGYVLAFDTSETSVYVAGGTQSNDFPSVPGGWHSSYLGDSADGFVLKFQNSSPYTLLNSTFVGTNNYDQVYGIQVDMNNNVYLMGQSLGGQFPVTPAGVYSNPNSCQFVMKMDDKLTTDIFSTVYGTGNPAKTDISPVAFLVDTCQNIYISGWGGDLFIPGMPASIGNTVGLPTTANAIQSTTDGRDFYFIVLGKNIQSLLYATFRGEPTGVGEHVDGGTSRFDKNGIVYQAICGGCGGSSAFPTTSGAWSVTNNGGNCNEIALKIAFQLGSVKAQAGAAPNATGCAPLTVNFSNASQNAVSYNWDFGDSNGSTDVTPTHVFTSPGVYNVVMIAHNPNACKEYDTVKLTITVLTNKITSNFTVHVTDSCNPYRVATNNTSQYSNTPGAQTFTQFTWIWGDGTSDTGTNPGAHNYPDTGTYTIALVMRDTTACNWPDTMRKTVVIHNQKMSANFTVPNVLCASHGVTFVSHSVNATGYQWTLGDGGTSTADSFVHNYTDAGTYVVKLIATNPNTCNKIDSMSKSVDISVGPTAGFDFQPTYPKENVPTSFYNDSRNATSYQWTFGDGNTSTDRDPVHQYKVTNNYIVCLIATSSGGCIDTVCKQVPADVKPIVDIPTGFTPNGDGNNDILYVRGVAIETMNLKIFNRWGQLVFESNEQTKGWDGTYNGKQQEEDAYAYVLNVGFYGGTTAQKKGNITLIR